MQPSKFNARTAAIVVDGRGRGLSLRKCAAKAGVHHETLADWMRTRPAFALKVERAAAEALEKAIEPIWEALPHDPRLALQVAERLDPEGWGQRTRQEISGPEGGPVTVKIDLLWPDGTTPPSQMP